MSETEFFEDIGQENIVKVAKEEAETRYRFVFAHSEIGIEVLADILINFCHFGCFLENSEQVAQHNVGINILSRMGIVSKENAKSLIQNLINVLPKKEE